MLTLTKLRIFGQSFGEKNSKST